MKAFVFFVALLMVLGGCEKEDSSPIMNEQSSNGNSAPVPIMRNSSASILNAANASQISTQFFTSKWAYKNKYVHITQYNGECSWTSYVLCAAAIINGDLGYYYYPVTHTKITYVKNWCGSSYIEDLRNYANAKDNAYFWNVYLCKQSKNSTGRFTMIKQMLYHVYVYQKPFIVIITNNNIGHYVVVWDIDWVCGGSGSTVYYTDPLDSPTTFMSQVKTMNFTTFLDRMGPSNNYVSKYCALFLR